MNENSSPLITLATSRIINGRQQSTSNSPPSPQPRYGPLPTMKRIQLNNCMPKASTTAVTTTIINNSVPMNRKNYIQEQISSPPAYSDLDDFDGFINEINSEQQPLRYQSSSLMFGNGHRRPLPKKPTATTAKSAASTGSTAVTSSILRKNRKDKKKLTLNEHNKQSGSLSSETSVSSAIVAEGDYEDISQL